MADPTTIERLKGLVLSAKDLRELTDWPGALIEDYLNILDNIITLANLIDVEIDQKIEEIPTDFTDGSVPFADSELLVEDNANFFWDIAAELLKLKALILNDTTASRLLATDATKKLVSVSNIIMPDDAWIGIGAALERIVFDAAGDITFMDCNVGIGIAAPTAPLDIRGELNPGIVMISSVGANMRFERAEKVHNAFLQFHTTASNPLFPRWSIGMDGDNTDDFVFVDTQGNEAIKIVDRGVTHDVSLSSDQFFVKSDGNVGINTVTPTQPLSVKEKSCMTAIGGFAVKLTNETGVVTVAGQLVKADIATNDAVILTATSDTECFGVFLDSGIADGAEAWVVISGIADVKFEDNHGPTRGDWVATSTNDVGCAISQASPAAAPTHFREIGHCIETVTAGGGGTFVNARCVLHFL